jgi:ABC-2 type transport system ATP-binding protein
VAVISASHVVKSYGPRRALDGLDLEVPQGAIYGFLGPNGAGKTTAMRVMLGLLRADAGEVRVLGRDPWGDGRGLRDRIGFLPSEPGLPMRMRGEQALDHFAALDGRPAVLRRRACDALALSAEDLGRPIRTYSRGMRQKLAIVQAVQHAPSLLVLDEPTEGLDPLVQRGFFELLRERRAAGTTVFFSSHILSEVEELCDRVAIIRQGRVVDEGRIEDLRRRRARRVTLVLSDPEAAVDVAGAEALRRDGARVTFDYHGDAAALVRALATLPLADVRVEDPGLDEVFLSYYRGEGTP